MKAVIISAQRCGGLFLAGCLSNHPDIHCPREEPFKRESIWQQKLGLGHAALLDFLLSEPFYPVSMCRLTYDQAFNPEIQGYLLTHQVRIIHLVRDVMPTVTSTLLAKQEMARGVPRHQFGGVAFADDEVLDVGPDEVARRIKHLLRQRRLFEERFGEAPKLVVRYEDVTQLDSSVPNPHEMARVHCFLEVIRPVTVSTNHKKMHKRPLPSYYTQWPAIETMLRDGFPEIYGEMAAYG